MSLPIFNDQSILSCANEPVCISNICQQYFCVVYQDGAAQYIKVFMCFNAIQFVSNIKCVNNNVLFLYVVRGSVMTIEKSLSGDCKCLSYDIKTGDASLLPISWGTPNSISHCPHTNKVVISTSLTCNLLSWSSEKGWEVDFIIHSKFLLKSCVVSKNKIALIGDHNVVVLLYEPIVKKQCKRHHNTVDVDHCVIVLPKTFETKPSSEKVPSALPSLNECPQIKVGNISSKLLEHVSPRDDSHTGCYLNAEYPICSQGIDYSSVILLNYSSFAPVVNVHLADEMAVEQTEQFKTYSSLLQIPICVHVVATDRVAVFQINGQAIRVNTYTMSIGKCIASVVNDLFLFCISNDLLEIWPLYAALTPTIFNDYKPLAQKRFIGLRDVACANGSLILFSKIYTKAQRNEMSQCNYNIHYIQLNLVGVIVAELFKLNITGNASEYFSMWHILCRTEKLPQPAGGAAGKVLLNLIRNVYLPKLASAMITYDKSDRTFNIYNYLVANTSVLEIVQKNSSSDIIRYCNTLLFKCPVPNIIKNVELVSSTVLKVYSQEVPDQFLSLLMLGRRFCYNTLEALQLAREMETPKVGFVFGFLNLRSGKVQASVELFRQIDLRCLYEFSLEVVFNDLVWDAGIVNMLFMADGAKDDVFQPNTKLTRTKIVNICLNHHMYSLLLLFVICVHFPVVGLEALVKFSSLINCTKLPYLFYQTAPALNLFTIQYYMITLQPGVSHNVKLFDYIISNMNEDKISDSKEFAEVEVLQFGSNNSKLFVADLFCTFFPKFDFSMTFYKALIYKKASSFLNYFKLCLMSILSTAFDAAISVRCLELIREKQCEKELLYIITLGYCLNTHENSLMIDLLKGPDFRHELRIVIDVAPVFKFTSQEWLRYLDVGSSSPEAFAALEQTPRSPSTPVTPVVCQSKLVLLYLGGKNTAMLLELLRSCKEMFTVGQLVNIMKLYLNQRKVNNLDIKRKMLQSS